MCCINTIILVGVFGIYPRNRCRYFKLDLAAVFFLKYRRQLRRERKLRDRNNPFDYMDDIEIASKLRLLRYLLIE